MPYVFLSAEFRFFLILQPRVLSLFRKTTKTTRLSARTPMYPLVSTPFASIYFEHALVTQRINTFSCHRSHECTGKERRSLRARQQPGESPPLDLIRFPRCFFSFALSKRFLPSVKYFKAIDPEDAEENKDDDEADTEEEGITAFPVCSRVLFSFLFFLTSHLIPIRR
jgi:hypothetical protein